MTREGSVEGLAGDGLAGDGHPGDGHPGDGLAGDGLAGDGHPAMEGSRAAALGDGRDTTGESGSLAAVLGDGREVAGVEAEVALAGLRRRMFAAEGVEPVRVGRYRVLEPIGRGGMGVVYRAHDPALGRDVALKLLRSDHHGHERRLRREARAMARLSHPNVVTVLEVGWHEDEAGAAPTAFVVMELVEGRDAAAWLAARERAWREVLEVFLAAGRGLAAAHSVGLVHRDFKPSNVLVGADGRVRVGDFGLAASVPSLEASEGHGSVAPSGPREEASTTATGARVGTPRYMAPEQRFGGRVDHRADQWSFAVSLWEALYGEHPFADRHAGRVDPRRPLPTRPGARRGIPAAIGRALARALAPRPERRHPSMAALLARLSAAADRRRRVGLPVAAVGVAGVAGVGLASAPRPTPRCDPAVALGDAWTPERRAALAEGFAATELPFAAQASSSVETRVDEWVAGWGRAYGAACEAAAGEDADVAHDVTLSCLRGELAELRALLELLEAPDRELVTRAERATRDLPEPARCSEASTALAGIDAALVAAHDERMAEVRAHSRAGRFGEARRLGAAAVEAAADVPRLRAEARHALGLDENRDGELEAAAASLHAAFYEAAATQDAELVARTALGLVTVEARRAAYDRAEEWIRHATPWIERVGEPARRVELQQELWLSTGELRYDQGRHDEALAELERVRAGVDDAAAITPRLLNQLGLVQLERSEAARAAELFVHAAALESRRSGASHPQVAHAINNLGNAHLRTGDYEEAERAYRRAHEIRLASLGAAHPSTAASTLNLGIIADLRGDRARAAELFEDAMEAFSAALGPEHPETARAKGNLAAMLFHQGQLGRSVALHREEIAIYDAALGPEHSQTNLARMNLASTLSQAGRQAEALALIDRVLAILEARRDPEDALYVDALRERAVILRRLGRPVEALELDRRVLALQEQLLGPTHPELAIVLSALADHEVDAERFEEAAALAERALAVGPTAAAVRGKAGYLLARALWSSGRERDRVSGLLDEAERELVVAGTNAAHVLRNLRRWRAEALPAGP